ncbi:MAG: hypothetical protein ABR956_07840 [Terracidiphilus sp.]|jgi:hypothetical protein
MKSLFTNQRFLTIYSGVLTAFFALTVFCGFAKEDRNAEFDQVTVHKLKVVEPDGTLRMVISDQAEFPGIIVKNKQVYEHKDRSTAGMLFFNEEGTENGGLTFGGKKAPDGTVSSYGHLSFDRYLQDQVFTEDASEDGPQKASGISIVDRPDWPITDILSLPQSDWKSFAASHPTSHQRIRLGRNPDLSASLVLRDPDGRPRMVLQVAADGTPTVQLLNADGKVVSQLPAAPAAGAGAQ